MLRSTVARHLPFLACILLAAPVLAGPLDPPAGPIASSGKTLTQVEPRTALSQASTPGNAGTMFLINKPGSYYLTDNLVVTKACGIDIVCANVSIDLNGFTISASGPVVDSAVRCFTDGQQPWKNITVRNGMVVGGFVGAAISSDAPNCRVESLTVTDSTDYGIVVGENSIIRDCIVEHCGTGINAGAGSRIEHCNVSLCATGISVGRVTISNCTISRCSTRGIYCYQDTVVESCTLRDNASGGGEGILVNSSGARIENNNISGSWWAIVIGSNATDNLITRNTVRKGGGLAGIVMTGQAAGVFPNNHVAATMTDPASPFATTNALGNVQY